MKQILLALTLLAGACHKDQPPGPTAEEANQLNDADAMLDSLANEEGPEANASSPSNSSD